ncbi:MAG: RtcB family protein, partial [Candidatus Woesearchaeota archaeon]
MVSVKNHAGDIDEKTRIQIEECASKPFVIGAALMPDAHAGYVAPIGSVLQTQQYVVPAWVGFDIGCGMTAVKITQTSAYKDILSHKQDIFAKVPKFVPMGKGKLRQKETLTPQTITKFKKLVESFKKGAYQKSILNFIQSASYNHLGTLGDGNHFIELCQNDDDHTLWIVVHSGSRGIGYKLAQKYMKIAAKEETKFEQTFPLDIDSQEGKEY